MRFGWSLMPGYRRAGRHRGTLTREILSRCERVGRKEALEHFLTSLFRLGWIVYLYKQATSTGEIFIIFRHTEVREFRKVEMGTRVRKRGRLRGMKGKIERQLPEIPPRAKCSSAW